MNILEFVQKQPFDWLGRTEAGSAILLVTKDDYESLRTLAARLAEAELDAARYRWLRASILTSECASVVMQLGEGDKMCAEKIDAAVDAAMAAETGGRS